jgi:hypothetical protein
VVERHDSFYISICCGFAILLLVIPPALSNASVCEFLFYFILQFCIKQGKNPYEVRYDWRGEEEGLVDDDPASFLFCSSNLERKKKPLSTKKRNRQKQHQITKNNETQNVPSLKF